MGKEEIAHYEQFLLFPQCFQKLSVVDGLKSVWRKGLRLLSWNNYCQSSKFKKGPAKLESEPNLRL